MKGDPASPEPRGAELLPCPFCGGKAVFGQNLDPPWSFVNCAECVASTNVLLGDSHLPDREEAAAAWNRRAPAP